MGYLIARLFGSYYLKKVRSDSQVLHYRRTPTWRSLVLFIVFICLSHLVSVKAPHVVLSVACYLLATYFSYIVTEKYEEVIFDKSRGTVSLMNSRFIEKHLFGYRKIIVTELSEVVSVAVDKQLIMGRNGHVVTLVFVSGLTLSLTAQCTFGERTEHDAIVSDIRQFLGLPTLGEEDAASTSVVSPKREGNVKKRRN